MITFLSKEYSRLILWAPFGLIFGILFYFRFQISLNAIIISLAIFTFLLYKLNQNLIFRLVLIITISFLLGALASCIKNNSIRVIDVKIDAYWIKGIVKDIMRSQESKSSIIVEVIEISLEDKQSAPQKIKILISNKNLKDIIVGDIIKFKARLYPIGSVLFPGGYDFGFKFKFEGIESSGFLLNKPKKVGHHQGDKFESFVSKIRQSIRVRLSENMDRESASFASALILGESKGLSKQALNDMRISGVSHVLCVSGLHLSLVAIMCFTSLRFALNLFDSVYLNFNIKKISGVFGIVGSLIYLYISGLQIAATRAFIMTGIFMMSIVIDRSVFPMRSISIAAFLMLLVNPEYIYHPSFQLSYIAVLSLISGFEILKKSSFLTSGNSFGRKVFVYIVGNIYSSTVVSLFTGPIAVYNFYFFSNYSTFSNLIIVPIVSFIAMPLSIISVILMTVDCESYTLKILQYFIEIILKVANYVTNLPYSTFYVGSISNTLLLTFFISFCWFLIWESRIRYIGILVIFISFILMVSGKKPALIVDSSDPSGLAISINQNGILETYDKKFRKFKHEHWANWFGQKDVIFKETDFHNEKINIFFENNNTFISVCSDELRCEGDLVLNYSGNSSCKSIKTITKDEILKYGKFLLFCTNGSCDLISSNTNTRQ